MKRNADFLLLVPLVLALGYVAITFQGGTRNELFVSSSLAPIDFGSKNSTPTIVALNTPQSNFTSTPTHSVTMTASPSSTATLTSTNTPSYTPSPTSTSIPTATSTPENLEVTSGITTGDKIVEAIERYYVDQGFYPATLNDLMPTYLPELPTTLTEQPYYYRMFESTHPMASEIYWLSFRVIDQSNTTCTYLRRLQYWDCNFSSP